MPLALVPRSPPFFLLSCLTTSTSCSTEKELTEELDLRRSGFAGTVGQEAAFLLKTVVNPVS